MAMLSLMRGVYANTAVKLNKKGLAKESKPAKKSLWPKYTRPVADWAVNSNVRKSLSGIMRAINIL